jgi:shikimate kinase
MGSGKTTIGKCLAKQLGLQFIDLDYFIENRYHKSIAQIFAEKGEVAFREMERNVLHEVILFEDTVVSTGGGVPCFFDNLEVINKNSTSIYLRTSPDELAKRLSVSKEKRPLIKDKSPEELKAFIASNLEIREAFYNQASYIYDVTLMHAQKKPETVVKHLIQYLSEHGNSLEKTENK